MRCLEVAEFSFKAVSLLLQLLDLKPVVPEVLLAPVTVLAAFQLTLETAAGTLHLGHLSGRGAKTETKRHLSGVNVEIVHNEHELFSEYVYLF